MRRLRAATARIVASSILAGAMFSVVSLSGAPVARAGTCSAGDVDYTVAYTSKSVLFTHSILYVSLAPGSSATRTISKTTSFTAGITFTAGATAEAGVIFAKASASVGVSLKAEGSTTSGTSVSLTATNGGSGYRDYVFFDGTRTATGTWKKYTCVGGTEKLNASGTWKSWNAQYAAVLNCDDDSAILSRYGSWSVQYKAAQTC